MSAKSVAHHSSMNTYGQASWPDGLVPWDDAVAPDLANPFRMQGRLRACGYCGSMHPTDLAAALTAGATLEWADWKYGWPHKAYIRGVPNPHAGMPERRAFSSEQTARYSERIATGEYDPTTGSPRYRYAEPATPAEATTGGKFYTIHLRDATAEERATIEAAMGVAFNFEVIGRVSWLRIKGGDGATRQ